MELDILSGKFNQSLNIYRFILVSDLIYFNVFSGINNGQFVPFQKIVMAWRDI